MFLDCFELLHLRKRVRRSTARGARNNALSLNAATPPLKALQRAAAGESRQARRRGASLPILHRPG